MKCFVAVLLFLLLNNFESVCQNGLNDTIIGDVSFLKYSKIIIDTNDYHKSGYDIDSLLNFKEMVCKEYGSQLSKEDSNSIINNCNVYRLLVEKEKIIKQFIPIVNKYNFPKHSKIIEYKKLEDYGVNDRAIVYWIFEPRVNIYCEDDYDCSSSMLGHGQYKGQIKFSLLDTKENILLNTVSLYNVDDVYFDDSLKETHRDVYNYFELPFASPNKKSELALGSRIMYKVDGGNKNKEGLTEVLNFDDFNGDGKKLEFALYRTGDAGCMGTESALIGYSTLQDSLILYPIKITYYEKNEQKQIVKTPNTQYWLGYTFTMKFKNYKLEYQIDYRGRGGCLEKYNLVFDDKEECFKGTVDATQTEFLENEKASWIDLPHIEK